MNRKKKRWVCMLWVLLLGGAGMSVRSASDKIKVLEQTRELLMKEDQEDKGLPYPFFSEFDSIIRSNAVGDEDFLRIINGVGEYFREQGKISLAVELYLNAVSNYDPKRELTDRDELTLMRLYIPLGASHEELGLWNCAMDFYLEALRIAENKNLDAYKAMIYNNIGAVYYNRSELQKAEEYIRKALEINLERKNTAELFNNYNNLAGICFCRDDWNGALGYALKAIQLLDSDADAYLYYFMQSNIAGLYMRKGDYMMAVSYLRNAITHQLELGFNSDLMQSYNSLSDVYSRAGRADSARIYLEKALQWARSLDNRNMEGNIQKKLSAYYAQRKDFSNAYAALGEYVRLNDSISDINGRKRMSDMEKIYDADKKMRENELLLKNIALQKAKSDRLRAMAFSVSAFLALAVLWLVGRYRSREKRRKVQEELSRHQIALFEKEKELQKQKEQELNYVLDQRNRELTSYTLYMVKSNEFVQGINEELKRLLLELNPRDKAHRQHLQQILHQLQRQNSTNSWDEFHYYFEQVHPSFYGNLESRFPDLTVKEKRLCAFLRLGLSSKDISAITFKEVRSVESARNRLRKKLGITPDSNLTDFLCRNFS